MAAVVRCRSQQGPRPGTRSLRRAMVLAQECKFNQGLKTHPHPHLNFARRDATRGRASAAAAAAALHFGEVRVLVRHLTSGAGPGAGPGWR